MTKVRSATGISRLALVTVAGVGGVAFLGGVGMASASAAGADEPAVGGSGPEGAYLRQVHERLHPSWVDGYIRMSPYKVLGPVTSTRQVEIAIDVRWDGTLERVAVTAPSGVSNFDTAAMNAVLVAAPFPPPVDALADDGLAHLKWRFARDHRLCSGAEVVAVEFPLEAALPKLVARGRLPEVVRRMSAELEAKGWGGAGSSVGGDGHGGAGDVLASFARLWLGRPNLNSDLDIRAAAALALAGDVGQRGRLEATLLSPLTAATAAEALDRLGVDVAALLGKALAGAAPSHEIWDAALAALFTVPAAVTSPACARCADVLADAALSARRPPATRLTAIALLGRMERTQTVAQALSQAAADKQPAAIRGAALLAAMPPGRGRPGVIRMAALLRDPAPEIRAAAAAGVLRAGGEKGLDQLYLLMREKDTRPLVAAAAELAHLGSEPSAVLLGKMLRRPEPVVRLAAIRALVERRDPAARNLVDPVLAAARRDGNEDLAVRLIALEGASPHERAAMAGDARLGRAVYRALIGAGQRAEAARWLLDNIERLPQEDRIAVLGDWIAAPRPQLAEQSN